MFCIDPLLQKWQFLLHGGNGYGPVEVYSLDGRCSQDVGYHHNEVYSKYVSYNKLYQWKNHSLLSPPGINFV
jgi:hypothetical protein